MVEKTGKLTEWKYYSVIDTLTLGGNDTIIISLAASAGGPNFVQVLCDLIEFKKIDTVSSGVDEKFLYSINNIIISPNPNDGKFMLKTDSGGEISIYNLFGEIIYFQSQMNKSNYFIDLSVFPDGIYILSFSEKAKSQKEALLKIK